jgi:cytosine/adenosine deaminase-related metal-dependent hydrolase
MSPHQVPANAARGTVSEDLIIRSGHVVTMDPGLGDIPTGMIVAPGLVETHWHLWNTLLRSMSGGMPGEDRPAGYFPVSLGLGQVFTDQDNYHGTLLACAEAINSGITTVHDWSHNVRGPAHAEAELRARAEAGLRARYSYGYSAGHPSDQVMDTGGLRALHRGWKTGAGAGGLLTLGVACRGPGGSNPAMRVPPGVYQREMATARELGLPVTVHASGPPAAAGQIAALAGAGLLGPDLQVVHANSATAAEIAQLAEAGCAVSLSPFSELLIGYGLPQTAELLAAGIRVGLSVDTTALTGNADMFAIMKLTQGLINATAHQEFACTARQALALGTIEGARSLDLDAVTGSLTPGKRADIILVATGHPNLGVLTDPAGLLVTAAQPGNVDTVLANGQILKRGGALVTLDGERITAQAREALAGIRSRAA